MGERMGGKEEMIIMLGTQITGMVVVPDRVMLEEEVETTIHKKEVGAEDGVEETTEEVEEAIIIQVVEAMREEKVETVAVTMKTIEVGEEIILIAIEVEITTVIKEMLVTVGQWRAEIVTTKVMEVITVTTGVGEAIMLTMVVDMTIIVTHREVMVMTIAMVGEEEVIGTVAEVVADQQNTRPRNWR